MKDFKIIVNNNNFYFSDVVEASTMRLVSMTGAASWVEMFLIPAVMKREMNVAWER